MYMLQPNCNKQQPYCKANNYNIAIIMPTFGKWLLDNRKAARLTQGELAKRAGISTSYVSTLEREEPHHITNAPPQPAINVVESIAQSLGVEIDDALLAAGYAPRSVPLRPTNATEFLRALESLGIKHFENISGIQNLTPDEYEDMLRDVRLTIEINLRRKES